MPATTTKGALAMVMKVRFYDREVEAPRHKVLQALINRGNVGRFSLTHEQTVKLLDEAKQHKPIAEFLWTRYGFCPISPVFDPGQFNRVHGHLAAEKAISAALQE